MGWSSLIRRRPSQGWTFVLGDQFEDRVETPPLLFGVWCLRCQPKPGAGHEGARTVQVLDYEAG